MDIHFYFHIEPSLEIKQLLAGLLTVVTQNQTILKEIKVTDAQVSTLLDQLNTTTNAIATAQTADAVTLGNVKTELEALIAAGSSAGLSDATSAKLTLLATAVGAVQTNATNNSTILNAIAAEGQPVIPAPPPVPPAPPTS